MAYRKSGKTAPQKTAGFSKKSAKVSASVKKRQKPATAQAPSEGMNSLLNTINEILSTVKPLIITWLQSYSDKDKQSDKIIGHKKMNEMSEAEMSEIGRKKAEELGTDSESK